MFREVEAAEKHEVCHVDVVFLEDFSAYETNQTGDTQTT